MFNVCSSLEKGLCYHLLIMCLVINENRSIYLHNAYTLSPLKSLNMIISWMDQKILEQL